MFIRNKRTAYWVIALGVIITLSNGYLFLTEHSVVRGLAFLVGIGWTWLGLNALRDLRNGDLDDR